MSTQCWIGTRKGLIQARRHADDSWSLSPPSFPGDPVTMVLPAYDGGVTYAALNLGHFGPKLHRSGDDGKSWQECKAPAFPAQYKAGDESSNEAKSVELIWILEHGANGDLWTGTVPAGLIRARGQGRLSNTGG